MDCREEMWWIGVGKEEYQIFLEDPSGRYENVPFDRLTVIFRHNLAQSSGVYRVAEKSVSADTVPSVLGFRLMLGH